MRTRVRIVTFSGIDGAGKSTQIQALEKHLSGSGFCWKRYSFWDNVVAFPRFREFVIHKAFKGEKGVGSPDNPVNRRDKNVNTWYTTCVRFFLYFLDTLNLRLLWSQALKEEADFIIFDRYIYDELANLPFDRWPVRFYVRALLRLAPKPYIAYLVDADPEAARLRKPEYPVDFLRKNREAYLRLSTLINEMKVVGSLSIEETTSEIVEALSGVSRDRIAFEFQPPCSVVPPDLKTPSL